MAADVITAELEGRYLQHALEATGWFAREHGYRPTYFLREVGEHGAAEAARRVIGSDPGATTEGFTRLWELGLMRHTVEFDAQLPWWTPLFTVEQRAVARERLVAHRYTTLDKDIASAEPPRWYSAKGI